MIVGFFGKGGSGKSSLSRQMALFLSGRGTSLLAIDADHNMDLSYNVANADVSQLCFFGQSLADLQRAAGIEKEEHYAEVFAEDTAVHFSLTPLSSVIAQYSQVLDNGIRLMTAGPQTDTVLYGKACSHILSTPLKILLPLLRLQKDEVVIVDEKAGADGVSTGIVTGMDVGVVVCEPSLHSIKTAQQIAELMDFYETPHIFVGNKIGSSEDKEFIISELGQEPVAFLTESDSVKRNPFVFVTEWTDALEAVFLKVGELQQNNRLERTMKKFARNREFSGV